MELNSGLDSTESCYLKSDENGLVATTKKVDSLVKGRGCTGYQAVHRIPYLKRPDIRLDIGYIKRPNIWLKIGQGKKGLSTRGKKVNTGIMNEVVHYGIHT